MKRHLVPARPHWQAKLERLGFDYHSLDGSYWQETACYELSAQQIDLIEEVTGRLHELCLDAIGFIISHDRFAQLGIDPTTAALIEQSWRQREPSLYGRFDLVYHPTQSPNPKLLEYNADTPTALFEASVVQWYWLQDNFPNADQFNSIHERLISQWRIIREWLSKAKTSPANLSSCRSNHNSQQRLTFATITDSLEDVTTCRYLQDTAIQAGFDTQLMDLRAVGWLENEAKSLAKEGQQGQFIDLNNQPIHTLFKLYPWEWLTKEPFAPHLNCNDTVWIEPIWKQLLSNKGILPILWERNPNHPNLLPSYFSDQRHKILSHDLPYGIIQKPLFSREGANISVLDREFVPTKMTTLDGYDKADDGPMIYQAMSPLPKFLNAKNLPVFPVIGSWVVGHRAAGIGIREDNSLITKDSSHFVPHYFVPEPA